jgi:alkylation response protein AidB-like acyl-CoA dehydrogenase
MQTYRPPVEDIRFQLETFDYATRVHGLPGFESFDLETGMSLVGALAEYIAAEIAPLNQKGDKEGVKFDAAAKTVTLPAGFRAAYEGLVDNGFVALACDPTYGGLGAPFCLSLLAGEVLVAANKSLSMCSGLSGGFIEALHAHGSDALKDEYLPNLVAGKWAGTMCLTEPQAGSDLGLVSTTAEPDGDAYRITGTKIWISFGEHDLTDNIIHLVLARLPGAPAGIKGISTFLVPKFLADGTRNPAWCTGTDHKMGIHASPTCVISLEGAKGWLVGEPHKGMKAMFTMMNAARLQVGMEGVGLGEAAFQAALTFARDRAQGRSLNPARNEAGKPADNILVHPDVRRQLLTVKSTTEGLRGLVAWMGVSYDVMHHSEDPAARAHAEDLVALLTPVIKSYGSERGFLNTSEAMQSMGGAGFTQDWPVEQYLRDVRIAMIYEGTNHIQALDLVGRKLPMHGGRPMQTFATEVGGLLRATKDQPELAAFREALKVESARLNATTMQLAGVGMGDPETVGAVASAYLNQFALVTLAFVWLKQASAVLARPEGDPVRKDKLASARFYFEVLLPEAELLAKRVAIGKANVMEVDVDLW